MSVLNLLLGDLLLNDVIREVSTYWQQRIVLKIGDTLFLLNMYTLRWSRYGPEVKTEEGPTSSHPLWYSEPYLYTIEKRYQLVSEPLRVQEEVDIPFPASGPESFSHFLYQGKFHNALIMGLTVQIFQLDGKVWVQVDSFVTAAQQYTILAANGYVCTSTWIGRGGRYLIYNLETKKLKEVRTSLKLPHMDLILGSKLYLMSGSNGIQRIIDLESGKITVRRDVAGIAGVDGDKLYLFKGLESGPNLTIARPGQEGGIAISSNERHDLIFIPFGRMAFLFLAGRYETLPPEQWEGEEWQGESKFIPNFVGQKINLRTKRSVSFQVPFAAEPAYVRVNQAVII